MPDAPKSFRMPGVKTYEEARENSHQRGYDRRWAKASEHYKKCHPLCEWCGELGHDVPSEHTDHIIPFHKNRQLRDDVGNWQALCQSCHSKKTVLEAKWIIAFVQAEQRTYITELNDAMGRPYRILELNEQP